MEEKTIQIEEINSDNLSGTATIIETNEIGKFVNPRQLSLSIKDQIKATIIRIPLTNETIIMIPKKRGEQN